MRVLLTILMLVGVAYGQSTYYIRYDTVKIGKGTGGPGELVVESSTKDTLNGVLINYNGGRTRFQRIRAISATQFTVGTDTITITGSGGGGGGTWGSITGTLSSQTDLQTALNAKAALVHTHGYSDLTAFPTQTAQSGKYLTTDGSVLSWATVSSGGNLLVYNRGTGQQTWFASVDTLYNKRVGNSYGLNWTTLSDSTLTPTIDSLLFTSKLTRQKIADSLGAIIATKQGSLTLTTTGTSGAATLIGNTLNVPQYQGAITLTTTGSSGAATLVGNTLNVPQYAGATYSAGYGLTLTSTTFAADTFAVTSYLSRKKLADSLGALFSGPITIKVQRRGTGLSGIYGSNDTLFDYTSAAGYGILLTKNTDSSNLYTVDSTKFVSYLRGGKITDSLGAALALKANLISPSFTTPNLGTPSAVVLTNATGTATALNIGGNAGTATVLATARKINGFSFNGSADIDVEITAAYALLGGSIKAEPLAGNYSLVSGSANMANGVVRFILVHLKKDATITGVKWIQVLQGNYTSSAYNGVGVYSVNLSTGELTLQASSTDDGNIWKATGNTLASKAFSSTVALSAGIYAIAYTYNRSAETTAPNVGSFTANSAAGLAAVDFSNSVKLNANLTGTALPSPTQAFSGLTGTNVQMYFALY